MSDDGSADENGPDPSLLRRQRAQGAAGDLARMGIDPRSLGLGGPADEPPSSDDEARADRRGAVVPLRPEFGTAPVASAAAPTTEPVQARAEPALRAAARPTEPPSRPDTGRLLRTVVRGLVTPDAAVAMQDERALVEAVRQRQSERRIVAFVAGKGGVGCSTVAVASGTTFVAMRDDRSVLVDVQQGTPSLGDLLGAERPATVTELLAHHEVVEPPVAGSGLGVVDGANWDLGLSRADVGSVLERLGSEHTFNLLDVGDDSGEGAHTALARADQVVVVTGPGEIGVAALRSALARVRQVNPMAADRAVTVIVCPYDEAHRDTLRELGDDLAHGGVVVVPPEPTLRAGAAYDPARVSAATREAFLRVAAGIAQP